MAMRATARFVMNTRGELQGQVVLARGTVALIEQLQSGHPHLPNGEPAVESITRNLGIRTRVKMLMAAKPDDGTQPAPGEDTRTRVFRWKA